MEEVLANDWTTASPEAYGLSPAHLQVLEEKINAGEFKKITSILVAVTDSSSTKTIPLIPIRTL